MEIVFQTRPEVWLGSSVFRGIPTIIQYDNLPMLEVGKFADAGYTTRFPIFHSDGTKLAVVNGSQLYLTEDGKKANVTRRCEPDLTVCEVDGRPILELRRHGAAALKGWAELYAPGGVLLKCWDSEFAGLIKGEGHLVIGGQLFMDALFEGHPIGIHFKSDGPCQLGIKKLRYSGPADKDPPFPSTNSPETPIYESTA